MCRSIDILKVEEFPEKLKNIKNPPQRLYLIGNKELIFEDSFAVIGTRKITEYGRKCAESILKELCLRNIVITSGMALGTDTVAHELALKYETKTIAVLGGGFENIFPKENEGLFNRIIDSGGLIISEYSPEEESKSEYFPKRNRIVSAISEGILVVEAATRSGTGITVNYGLEQGKLIFAIPGPIDSKYSKGVHDIIKKGGILTTEACDILERFPQFKNKKGKKWIKKENNQTDKISTKIYNVIKEKVKNIDEIIKESKLDRNTVLNYLFEMQIEGVIEEEIGVGYRLKKK